MSRKLFVLIFFLFSFLCFFFLNNLPTSIDDFSIIPYTKDKQQVHFENNLKVFTNSNLTESVEYSTLRDGYNIGIFGVEVWGFCFKSKYEDAYIYIASKSATYNIHNVKKNNNDPECKTYFESKLYSELKIKKERLLIRITSSFLFAISLSLILAIFLTVEKYYKKNGYKLVLRKYFILIFSSGLILIIYSLMTYPAIIGEDFLSLYKNFFQFKITDWFGLTSESIFQSIVGINQHPYFVSVYMIFLSLISISFAFYVLIKNKLNMNWIYYWILMFAIPTYGLGIMFYSRDLLQSFVHIVLTLYLILRFYKPNKNICFFKFDFIFIIFIVLGSELRREAIAVSLLMFLILLVKSKYNFKKKIILICSLIAFKGLFKFGNDYINPYKDTNIKILVTASHYVGHFLVNNYKTQTPEQDKKVIEKFYNYDILTRFHAANDVVPTHNGAIKYNHYKHDINELYELLYKMISENFLLTIEGRLKMIYYQLGPSFQTVFFPQIAYGDIHFDHRRNMINISNLDKYLGYENVYLNRYGIKIMNLLRTNKVARILYSVSFSAIFLFLIMIFYKKFGVLSLISGALLIRVVIFFILSPSAQFKYLQDIFMISFLIVPFVVHRMKNNFSN